jgi:hypothetical protein
VPWPGLRRSATLPDMASDYRLDVPPGFDDSDDDDGQVHPIARRLFTAESAGDVFDKAGRWIAGHDVRVVDVTWNWLDDESEPFMLSVYFVFETNPDDD